MEEEEAEVGGGILHISAKFSSVNIYKIAAKTASKSPELGFCKSWNQIILI